MHVLTEMSQKNFENFSPQRALEKCMELISAASRWLTNTDAYASVEAGQLCGSPRSSSHFVQMLRKAVDELCDKLVPTGTAQVRLTAVLCGRPRTLMLRMLFCKLEGHNPTVPLCFFLRTTRAGGRLHCRHAVPRRSWLHWHHTGKNTASSQRPLSVDATLAIVSPRCREPNNAATDHNMICTPGTAVRRWR